jgi:hypothetical protein
MSESAITDAVQLLDAHADYKVMRRILPREVYAEADGRKLLRGVIIDTCD